MEQQKTPKSRLILAVLLLALTLPLTYYLFTHLILPTVWDEPQFNSDETSQSQLTPPILVGMQT